MGHKCKKYSTFFLSTAPPTEQAIERCDLGHSAKPYYTTTKGARGYASRRIASGREEKGSRSSRRWPSTDMAPGSNPCRHLRNVIKGTKRVHGLAPSPVFCEGSEYLEVPFETLNMKKSFSTKDKKKANMKLHSLRLGGLVGTKSGLNGCLTYSMDSTIWAMKTPSESCSLTRTDNVIRKTAVVELQGVERYSANGKMISASIPTVQSRPLTPKIPATTADSIMSEVPVYAVSVKRPQAGYKAKMAESMIRLGGIYGEKGERGVSTIVYGSFQNNLQF